MPYVSEQDLDDILRYFKLHVVVFGNEYMDKQYTGKGYCETKGIDISYNARGHRFSSSGLRKQVKRTNENK